MRSIWPPLRLSTCALAAFLSQDIQAAKEFQVQAFFNHRESEGYMDPYRKQKHDGDNFEAILVDAVSHAQKRVWMAVYELRLPQLAKSLVDAKNRGVDVRIVLEEDNLWAPCQVESESVNEQNPYATSTLQDLWNLIDQNQDGVRSQSECMERDAILMLQAAKIPFRTDGDSEKGSAKSALMHHKFLLVDQNELFVSSANFTLSDVHGDFSVPTSQGNANAMLKFQGASRLRTAFENEFELMFTQKKFSTQKPRRAITREDSIDLQFSPRTKSALVGEDSTTSMIETELKKAKKSVDIAQFVFSEQRFTDALNPLLSIRVAVDPGFAVRYYSELLDLWGLERVGANCQPETGNNAWGEGIGSNGMIPTLAKSDKLHHKFGVVDEAVTIFGSHNWTEAAATKNDETLLVLRDVGLSKDFAAEMDRIYRLARRGVPKGLASQFASEKSRCQN